MVGLKEYKESLPQALQQNTLCFLIRGDQVLLAMKKRAFGEGKWNGPGGKPEEGETILEAAVRETREEVRVTPLNLRQVAVLDFYQPHQPRFDQRVIVFLTDQWKGEIGETGEMTPQWFDINQLPFDSMWADDRLWLPLVLAGETLRAEFLFTPDDQVAEYIIEEDK